MARQEIVLGTPPTGLGGDPPRVASIKINAMTLELYGAGGIGGIAGKMDRASALIADPNNTAGGFTYSAVGHASNPTELNVAFSIFTIPGNNGNSASQFAWPLNSVTANKNRVWYRQAFNNVWSPWTENITVTSMAALFGFGGTSPATTDLDALSGTGIYRHTNTATGGPGSTGLVLHMQYGGPGQASSQLQINTTSGVPTVSFRSKSTSTPYSSWVTVASIDTVEARLAFYGIGLAAADQAQATSNLNTATVPNRYRVAANATGKPGTLGGTLEVVKGFANTIAQWFTESGNSTFWVRSTADSGATWSAWDQKASQTVVNTKFDASSAQLDPQYGGGLMSATVVSGFQISKFLNGDLVMRSTAFTTGALPANTVSPFDITLPAGFVSPEKCTIVPNVVGNGGSDHYGVVSAYMSAANTARFGIRVGAANMTFYFQFTAMGRWK